MLMMHAPRGNSGEYQINNWAPEDFKAHIAFMHQLNQELTEAGEFVGAQGLAPPGQARVVRAGKQGVPAVTDGPFPEAKEFLLGYWIVDVDNPERAFEIAAKLSAGPAPDAGRTSMPIEVRQIMSKRTTEL